MTSYKATDIQNRLLEFCGLLAFRFHGLECDVDPFNPQSFHVVCDGVEREVSSIEEVMNGLFFDGCCLKDIAEDIEIIEW